MYFKRLKYIVGLLLLAGAARGGETLVLPPLFEDFPGPMSLRLPLLSDHMPGAALARIETLVPAAELGPGVLRIRRIGLRLDESAGSEAHRLRGLLTIATTPASRLGERFGETVQNRRASYFLASRSEPARAGRRAERLWFDLPEPYRLEPGVDGNLVLHFQLEVPLDTPLDLVPALEPRLLVGADPLAAQGAASAQSLVVLAEVERELPAPPVEVARRGAPRPARGRAEPPAGTLAQVMARAAAAEQQNEALLCEMQELRDRMAGLESELTLLAQASAERARSLETAVVTLVRTVSVHQLEGALASGRPGPSLLAETGQLDSARELVAEAIRRARERGDDVGSAASHLEEGDTRLLHGERALAFVSYSLAFRSVMRAATPFSLGAGASLDPVRPASLRLAERRRGSPYDLAYWPRAADAVPAGSLEMY